MYKLNINRKTIGMLMKTTKLNPSLCNDLLNRIFKELLLFKKKLLTGFAKNNIASRT